MYKKEKRVFIIPCDSFINHTKKTFLCSLPLSSLNMHLLRDVFVTYVINACTPCPDLHDYEETALTKLWNSWHITGTTLINVMLLISLLIHLTRVAQKADMPRGWGDTLNHLFWSHIVHTCMCTCGSVNNHNLFTSTLELLGQFHKIQLLFHKKIKSAKILNFCSNKDIYLLSK